MRFGTLAAVLAVAGCGGNPPTGPDLVDVPLDGLTLEQRLAFDRGDELFDLPLRPADGLGPLYIRQSCSGCHTEALRGPGSVQKMAIVEADGVTPAADQSALPWGHTVRPFAISGASTPLQPPAGNASLKLSVRVGPPALGLGYLEAIADEEIERVAAEQAGRADGIHGTVNRTTYRSEPNPDSPYQHHQPGDPVIGRFGLKARLATLDEFTADALQGDMGITNPLRPGELPNPDGVTDDARPGVDVGLSSVNVRADYLRMVAIPERRGLTERGRALFASAGCAVCHVPALHTRADYPLAPLADIDAPVYTDMLLHRMGTALADGLSGEGQAGSMQWRTAPLIGLRFNYNYLHDGRAGSVEEAITGHAGEGSEANPSVGLFNQLSSGDRQALLDFVEAL